MIEAIEIKGNVLDCNCKYIVHQVNCKGIMGSGLALQVRNRYPNVYEEYIKMCRKRNLLGEIQIVPIDNERNIVNMFTQENIGRNRRQTDYKAMLQAFNKLFNIATGNNGGDIAIPKLLGCGLAGGNWETVLRIIQKAGQPYTKGKDIKFYIVEWVK